MRIKNSQDERSTTNSAAGGDFQRLSDCSDLEVAEGYPDIRGWDVRTRTGQTLGKVDDLIISTAQMRARYIDVQTDSHRHALLPIGTAQLDDQHDNVIVDGLDETSMQSYPQYSAQQGFDREYEQRVRERYANAGSNMSGANTSGMEYDSEHYDDQRLYASRRGQRRQRGTMGTDAEQRVALSEEELEIGKRKVQAGEVEVRKHVETEHVSESVPLMREEITMERRPIQGGDMNTSATIGTDAEIRIPLMREEAVVAKRAVPREEVIIRKRAVTENRTVEADLRRERIDVDGARDISGEDGGMQSPGATR